MTPYEAETMESTATNAGVLMEQRAELIARLAQIGERINDLDEEAESTDSRDVDRSMLIYQRNSLRREYAKVCLEPGKMATFFRYCMY